MAPSHQSAPDSRSLDLAAGLPATGRIFDAFGLTNHGDRGDSDLFSSRSHHDLDL